MATAWQTVRVFLSSTFRDMHAERDHLIKVTFPALRERLLPHRVELYDIDLRWGITKDEAKNEKVIGLCLESQGTQLALNQARPTEGLPLVEEALRIAARHSLVARARQIEPIIIRNRGLLELEGNA